MVLRQVWQRVNDGATSKRARREVSYEFTSAVVLSELFVKKDVS
jgi:hypothetical protein